MKKLLTLLLLILYFDGYSQDITSNLIGHWPLDGTFEDLSDSSFNGTGQGNVTFGPGVNNEENGATIFDGINSNIALSHSGLLNLSENFTISAWIKVSAFPVGTAHIFSTLDVVTGSQTKGIGFGINTVANYGRNANSLALQVGNSIWQWDVWTSPSASITTNQWQHVTVTVQNSSSYNKTITFYVDGISKSATLWATPESPINWGNLTTSNMIGAAHSNYNSTYFDDQNFNGSIADLRVYNRALVQDDVTLLASTVAGTPIPSNSLWSENAQSQLYFGGDVGIGTDSPDEKLTVKGTVHAEKVKVDLNVPGPDYVFDVNYSFPTLKELKKYIERHKHLPEIPSAKEMEANGIDIGNMSMLLLKKIEELTLYQINLLDKLNKLEQDNEILSQKIKELEVKKK